ncbi:recombinase family protein [Kocuria marina]|uniref:recombinase family protein n=1 Tax=Kocuria marina TaxID=223184 RepID=UPI002989FA33|nr:recombinase family protein [Kocuria marina]MCT2022146.1 recombinase family protein [Kocuria marina]
MKIGYARVSTREQAASLATQREALTAAGCERVFADTISGARSTRPGLDAARSYLRTGDALVVTRLGRLGRSMRDTVTTAAELTDNGVRLVVLDIGLDVLTEDVS